MDIANLIRMANRIGDYFAAYPDREEAMEGAATHIQKFWEPRMRVALLDFLAAHEDGQSDDIQLHALMRDAVVKYQARLTPARAV
ncbi:MULTISPECIES: formate dehydrogenase subunit delta [unclassified Bordetella]|uniref:formate dehydrogenase subunit delta n=1 Tax=unclassified Bordetella TaxID=2630031 RepID=UPI0013216128|nr:MULTISPECIES: formate dehydrogenase subunit delta [unclassified Bordetella]MVW70891.1 formate dehydrogenase [Bordetella sp. 15P40C-2]MVW79512.1 formate dehydrogenase [Bordetella sp. 02P26C-1]